MEPALRFEHQCGFFFFYRVDVNNCFLSFSPKLLPLIYAEKPLQPHPWHWSPCSAGYPGGEGKQSSFCWWALFAFPLG